MLTWMTMVKVSRFQNKKKKVKTREELGGSKVLFCSGGKRREGRGKYDQNSSNASFSSQRMKLTLNIFLIYNCSLHS